MNTVSQKLRQAIQESGRSLRQIANDIGMCRISLVKWMNGTQLTITTDAVDKLAEYLGLALVQVSPPPPPQKNAPGPKPKTKGDK